jgi:hypothetical protein
MGNFVEKDRKLKKLKHVSALACIFGRRETRYFTLNIVTNKYRGLITSYEINTYTYFLDTFLSRKLYFSENSLCDVMSHR